MKIFKRKPKAPKKKFILYDEAFRICLAKSGIATDEQIEKFAEAWYEIEKYNRNVEMGWRE